MESSIGIGRGSSIDQSLLAIGLLISLVVGYTS
jgi:hypothetical protein